MFMKVQASSVKKNVTKDSRIETTTQMVQYTTLTTEDLVDGREIIKVHIAWTPTPKKEPYQFRNCV